ncbi:hypothetical protein FB451DRAFT_290212 [Mycena latifolia]|nr:hypothetical protein FB451DRAFT_290212 [Mycena latifolia]
MPHGISYTCPDCLKECQSARALSKHRSSAHRQFTPASEGEDENDFQCHYHPLANALACDANGNYLPPHAAPPPPPPPPQDGQDPDAWYPFESRAAFAFAQFYFVELQTSERNINTALDIWAASVTEFGCSAPWANAAQFYTAIDSVRHGDLGVKAVAKPGRHSHLCTGFF